MPHKEDGSSENGAASSAGESIHSATSRFPHTQPIHLELRETASAQDPGLARCTPSPSKHHHYHPSCSVEQPGKTIEDCDYIMILSGREIITRRLVQHLRQVTQQQQPCGVDLTLRQISKWTSAATIDFDNTNRQAAKASSLPFDQTSQTIMLQPGAYLVDFNETVLVPRNCMASVFPRSSLWRSGVGITAGVVDAGYEGAMGALMEVKNPRGVVLYKDAKLAQIVFEELGESVEGYNGIYQSSTTSVGRDGSAKV